MQPATHRRAPLRNALPRIASHRIATSFGLYFPRIAALRSAPRLVAASRIVPRRSAARRPASQRNAAQRNATSFGLYFASRRAAARGDATSRTAPQRPFLLEIAHALPN